MWFSTYPKVRNLENSKMTSEMIGLGVPIK